MELFLFIVEAVMLLIFFCISAYIVIKSKELLELSDHKGIRSFRDAFFYYCLTIVVFIIAGVTSLLVKDVVVAVLVEHLLRFFFAFTQIMFVLSLSYSFVWKYLQANRSYLFPLIAAVISLFYLFNPISLIISQLIIIMYIVILAFEHYSVKKSSFAFQYFISLILLFISTVVEYLGFVLIKNHPWFVFIIMLFVLATLLSFVNVVMRVTSWQKSVSG